jgi:superfamily II DNA or RNA helicase
MSKPRARLIAAYESLTPQEKLLIHLCSIIHEPTTPAQVLKCLKIMPPKLQVMENLSTRSVAVQLNKLESLKLVNERCQCHEDIVEIVTRRAVAAGHFEPMAKAVKRTESPMPYYAVGNPQFCHRSMRDLRMGIYGKDMELIGKSYDHLMTRCKHQVGPQNPVIRVCANPFDAVWFRATLTTGVQTFVLAGMFHKAIMDLEPDREALACATGEGYLASLPPSEAKSFYHSLALRLVMGGRLERALEVLSKVEEPSFSGGLRGVTQFIQGRIGEAVDSFEADLKALRSRSRKRKCFFQSGVGVFFILALLQQQDAARQKEMEGYIDTALSSGDTDPALLPIYNSLNAIAHIQRFDQDTAREIIARMEHDHREGLALLFSALAEYWLDGKLSQKKIDSLSRIFIKTREMEMEWLAMESAALLCRVEQETPIRANYLRKIEEQTGMRSFVSAVRFEEPWQKGLRALVRFAQPEQKPAAAGSGHRLVWLFSYRDGEVSLQPKEQKLTAKGNWSKGRSVALTRLYAGTNFEYLSRQDHVLRTTIEKRYSSYYYEEYVFNMDKALPALVGHPLVFLESSPTMPVEIVKGDPEVLVTQAGSSINIQFATPAADSRVAVIQETPTRFKIMEFSEEQKRIAKILGEKGLEVPASAKDEVIEAIASVSSMVTVHSTIGGTSREIVEIEGDPTPHMHLMPAGQGFRLEMFVRPFKEGGPYLKPGVGAQNVIADVGGAKTQARRDLKGEEELAATVEGACPVLQEFLEMDRQWHLTGPEECLQVLLDLKDLQDQEKVVVLWPEGEKLRVTREASFDKLRLKIRSRADWFEMSGELALDDTLVVDMKRLLELMQTTNSRFIPLGEGQFLALTRELTKRLKELEAFSDKRGKAIGLHPLAALAIEDFTESLPHLDADRGWKAKLEQMHAAMDITPAVPSTLKAELRDYQEEGYTWLARLAHMGFGACLADDMGLGKTIQALGIILARAPMGPTLVVAPTSVCMNWIDEAKRFAPTLRTIVFGGNQRESLVKGLEAHDVLICSYGLLHQESDLLGSIEWTTIVLDEAQAIKNVMTKRSQAAMGLKGAFKVITTGTPIENHLGEFWTLFNFINPGLLGSFNKFNERYAVPIEKYNDRDTRKRLKKLISPFILRRTKAQVLDELPPRTEVTLQVEMSPEESAFYEALRQQAIRKLEEDDAPAYQKHLKILAEIMKLRRAACNPRLVMPDTPIPSAKLELFGEVIGELLENRHKALVFSQFVGHLKLIREYLDGKKIDYRYLDGSTPPKDRKKEVDAFQAGRGDLFLISLKAGGLGLNLTAADYVIHMDPWWNPAVEDQASDRAHRIGQRHPVTVYRLVAQHTIEEKIVKLHQDKRDLAGSLLDGTDISGKISADELLRLIREQ